MKLRRHSRERGRPVRTFVRGNPGKSGRTNLKRYFKFRAANFGQPGSAEFMGFKLRGSFVEVSNGLWSTAPSGVSDRFFFTTTLMKGHRRKNPCENIDVLRRAINRSEEATAQSSVRLRKAEQLDDSAAEQGQRGVIRRERTGVLPIVLQRAHRVTALRIIN